MPNRFLEWLGRVVMLSLAGMITLSIIGAIAAIPRGSVGERPALAPASPPAPRQPDPQAAPEAHTQGQANIAVGPAAGGRHAIVAAPAPLPDPPERWLETIAYALLALVGTAALATLLLARSLAQRRRIAEALEALASR